uniref:Uncharacterized protein n=1 Tax=Populus davidiana TaxID=266767 RepID=A0A6M2EXB8_9ROSI
MKFLPETALVNHCSSSFEKPVPSVLLSCQCLLVIEKLLILPCGTAKIDIHRMHHLSLSCMLVKGLWNRLYHKGLTSFHYLTMFHFLVGSSQYSSQNASSYYSNSV